MSESQRIILLLDLDCFYAQCESVRLGLDPSIPLALIQWDSALAVNYPARTFGIKRGDSFTDISTKSGGKCTCIHLPILPVHVEGSTATTNNQTTALSEEEAYQKEFCMPPHLQKEAFIREKNVIRKQSEGKASLDRYRLASSRIFATILQALIENVGKGKFILERASIDEMYVDVTSHCYDLDTPVWSNSDSLWDISKKESVIVGCNTTSDDNDDTSTVAIWRGSVVARGIRKFVYDNLGFTLSAGISINKLLAKLGASYGKPDGQAIILPDFIPNVMNNTPIRTARGLGGKLGKRVSSLLPDDVEDASLGCVARLFSLQELSSGLGSEEAGQLVFNICRGIDNEPVKETFGALIKSITASKNFVSGSVKDIHKWISLLADDVLRRVDIDTQRNNRVPKRFAVNYLASTDPAGVEWKEQSIRLEFPKEIDPQARLNKFTASVCAALEKRGLVLIRRIGLSATDFEVRAKNGIDAFFTRNPSKIDSPQNDKSSCQRDKSLKSDKVTDGLSNMQEDIMDESSASCLVNSYHTFRQSSTILEPNPNTASVNKVEDREEGNCGVSNNGSSLKTSNLDLEYARKLQNSFDKEHKILSSIQPQRQRNIQRVTQTKTKIETFFEQQKKVKLWEPDQDHEYAKKLQAAYDRENSLLSSIKLGLGKKKK